MKIKNIIFTSFLIITCFTAISFAEEKGNPIAGQDFSGDMYVQDAYDAANNGVEIVFPYTPNNVYKIYLQPGFITDIRLPAGERVKYVGGGDTTRWIIENATIGGNGLNTASHIYIKPVQRGINTNIIINTDQRSYQLTLIAGGAYNPIVSWVIPKTSSQFDAEGKIKNYGTINAQKLNFDYTFNKKNLEWSPARVFDNGNKTYIQLKPSVATADMPAFFVLNEKKELSLVNYRAVKGYLIVDRLFDTAVLMNGQEKVTIKRAVR